MSGKRCTQLELAANGNVKIQSLYGWLRKMGFCEGGRPPVEVSVYGCVHYENFHCIKWLLGKNTSNVIPSYLKL